MYTDRADTDLPYTDDPLRVYLDVVRTVPPLTEGEAEDLLRYVRAHDEQAEAAHKRLVEAHLHLVPPIAERHRSSGVEAIELVEKGNEGLIRAVETFAGDYASGFSAHATTCIEQAVSAAAAAGPIARSFPHLPNS
jgi:DNA-directed RNA polymerase sigma subunit (sigma70/sigma32)